METGTVNVASWRPGNVTLIDGTVVLSDSEEWRHECEAKHILDMPNKPIRVSQLDAIEKKRGLEARQLLEAKILEIFYARQALAGNEAVTA